MSKSSRRQFIKKLSLAVLGGLTTSMIAYPAALAKRKRYKVHKWTGDNFNSGHKLRDEKIPRIPKSAQLSKEVVIVGGGLSGLASAYYLKDRDFLLLEQYDKLGGHCRGGTYRGIDYPIGSAYYADNQGYLSELIDELNLEPAVLKEKKDSWYWGDGLIADTDMENHIFYKNLKELRAESEKVTGQIGPRLIETFKTNQELRRLDTISMQSLMNRYDPKFNALFDSFFKSSLCGSAKNVSALAGYYLIEDLFNPTYILPGGNQAIAKALINRLRTEHPDSLKTEAFVWSIELNDRGALVTYSDQGKQIIKVQAKHLIIAIPHMVAARLITNLPKKTKQTLYQFKYGSYLVANLLLNKRVYDKSYDSWFSSPYDFADISLADTPYLLNKQPVRKDASVLTVFQPYEPASMGRILLLNGNRKKIAERVVDQVSSAIPEIKNELEEITLTRWGHALAVADTGYFKRIEQLQSSEDKRISFTHSSSQGLPSVEAAVDAARRATDKLIKKEISSKVIYSYASNSG